MDRGGEHRGGGGLGCTVLEVDPQLAEDLLRVAEHVHEVRDGGALVSAHVRDTGLEQALGDREDAFAVELVTIAETQLLDLGSEGALSHGWCPFG